MYAAQFIGTPRMNILKNILPDGMMLGFRPEKLYLNTIEESHIIIDATIMTKEMLGSEIIYSLKSKFGTLMAKSENEVEDGINIKLFVPFTSMYLFDKNEKRIPLGEAEKEVIEKIFS